MSLLSPESLSAFLALTFLEIVLGIDNILFITLLSNKLDAKNRKQAIRIGLILAMGLRILLLLGLTLFIGMQEPLFSFQHPLVSLSPTGQSLILFLGGLFLIYKATKEIYERVELPDDEKKNHRQRSSLSFSKAIIQITAINFVFSFDSILTAVGMTNGLEHAVLIMGVAIVVSVLIIMLFAGPVGGFVSKHPSLQVLGMAFLLLIGFMLVTEAAHLSHAQFLNRKIGSIPKGYLYFAIAFSLVVEFVNMRIRSRVRS